MWEEDAERMRRLARTTLSPVRGGEARGVVVKMTGDGCMPFRDA